MESNVGLLARIEARPEHADAVETLLRGALDAARSEERTVTWFAFRESPTVFGIFDTFTDEAGRTAHLNGPIAAALMEIAPTLLAGAPDVRPVDVLAVKSG
ncbi:antibiotic biosynthesis monooxygenase [Kitasatospora sp. NPDC048545]|uniref:putative quinol monooxygenase n=1 Tax=Kitasatospora sp. NPDC048545 TaxID=3157208 RepID=UPI0033DB31A8